MIGKCTLDCFACCLCYPIVKLFLERIQLSHMVSFFYFCPSVSPAHKNNPKSELQHVRVPLSCVLSWCLRASEDDWTFALRIPVVHSLSLVSLLMLHKLGGLSFESPMVMYGLIKAVFPYCRPHPS